MTNHTPPIVPHVLYVADQQHPWQLAPIERLATRYHTPTTVALVFGTIDSTVKPQQGKSGATKQQYHVWCIPDDAAWQRIERARADLQLAIDALADELRRLGLYAKRLDEAGGIKAAPNPLSPTVISAPDPDRNEHYWQVSPIPRISRSTITGHTPKMLRGPGQWAPDSETTFAQRDHFVCPDDDAWQAVQDYRALTEVAHIRWQKVLSELGTYQAALADGRYSMLKEQAAPAATAPPAPRTPSLIVTNVRSTTDLDNVFFDRLTSAGYTWQFAKQTPDGRWHHLISVRNTALRRNDQVLRRRERLEALVSSSAALIPAAPPIAGVPMMDAAEARAALDRMAADLDQVDTSIASFRQQALDFAEREGWKALGYSGSAEAINAELGTQYSKSYLSRLLNAAKIERLLELPAGNSEAVPERTLRPLGQLNEADQRQAWSVATAAAGGAVPNTAQVQQAVQQVKPQVTTPQASGTRDQDAQHIAAARHILRTLDQWADGALARLIQNAYGHARQIRNNDAHTAMMAEVDRAVEAQTAPAPIPAELEARAGRAGLSAWVASGGGYVTSNTQGAANYQDHPTLADLEAYIARKEDAAAVIAARGAPAAPAPDWNAIAKLTYHLGSTTDTEEVARTYRAIGMLLRTSGVLPALPTRPRAPRSADIADQLQYLGQLEDYADALEAAVAAREQAVVA